MTRGLMLISLLTMLGLLGCSSPRAGNGRTDEVLDAYPHRMMTSAHAAFSRGDIARAAELYERAWIRARIADRPVAIGASAYNLALCRIALGRDDRVAELLAEAIVELERAGESTYDVQLVQAEYLRSSGETSAAWSVTDALLENRPPRPIRAQTRTLRALLAMELDDFEAAREEWQQAEREGRRVRDERIAARLAEIEGQIALVDDDLIAAATAFDREAHHYRNIGRYTDMSRALARAADVWMLAAEPVKTLDRSYRAARHYAAADQWTDALQLLDRALPALEDDEVEDLMIQRFAALVDEVASAMKKAAARDVQE